MPPIHQHYRNMIPEFDTSTMMSVDEDNQHYHSLQWTSLLPEIRYDVLQYLDEADLAEYSMVSRQCRDESQDPSFSQRRTAVVRCKPYDGFHYLHPLAAALLKVPTQTNNHSKDYPVFSKRFTSFQIENPSFLPKIMNREAKPIIKALAMKHVTRLDMSSQSNNNSNPKNHHHLPQVASSVAKLMTQVTPDVETVDLSHNQVGTASLADFSRNCKQLTTIRLVGGMLASSVSGMDLKQCESLKELYLNDTLVSASAKETTDVFLENDNADSEENCPFRYCARHLERVSLKGCRYFNMTAKQPDGSLESQPFTQVGLVKFVRNAPNLKWFESDLTPENVKLLQYERPDVVFVGHAGDQ